VLSEVWDIIFHYLYVDRAKCVIRTYYKGIQLTKDDTTLQQLLVQQLAEIHFADEVKLCFGCLMRQKS
jgi:hypothetical protein